LQTHIARGEQRTIIGCIGDEAPLREAALLSLPGVESVTPVLKPYKLASREFSAASSTVRVGDGARSVIGSRTLAIIAGPCSVEGPDMLLETARALRAAGEGIMRGVALKHLTSQCASHAYIATALRLPEHARAASCI